MGQAEEQVIRSEGEGDADESSSDEGKADGGVGEVKW